jgi:hypothetical protein
MNRNSFLQSLVLLGATPYFLSKKIFTEMEKTDNVRLLRHATLVITIGKNKTVG